MTKRTIRQTIEGMPLVFDPAAAGDLEAVIQFKISGEEPASTTSKYAGVNAVFTLARTQIQLLTSSLPQGCGNRSVGAKFRGATP